MTADSYKVLGVMSGTSLDGMDLALCKISCLGGDRWQFQLLKAETFNYSPLWREKLSGAIYLSSIDLLSLHHEYGRLIGSIVADFLKGSEAKPSFVSSHGHTVFHQVERGFTFQVGHGQEIANVSGLPTICDFRSLDVSLGGHGAPLVPIGDTLFFGNFDACLNLGGIANISYERDGERQAYDVGLANMLLNYLMEEVDRDFDENGELAMSGTEIPQMLEELNSLPYFDEEPPKSLGVEWFNLSVVPILNKYKKHPLADRLCTSTVHCASQIATSLASFGNILVTGGGAKNAFLIKKIEEMLGLKLATPDEQLIDFKEAIVFALMGVLRLRGEVNCLRSVTGARMDSCGGVIFNPEGKLVLK